MADEVTDIESRLQAIMEQHLTRTHDIIQAGYDKSQAICDEAITGFKRRSGVRSQLLDQALTQLGIAEPPQ